VGLQGPRRRQGQALTPLLVAGIALAALNACVFLLFGFDKLLAKLGRRRVSERALLGAALLGGGPGAWLGMAVFRHKTQKPRFGLGVPALALAQAAIGAWLFVRSR
jgi:uncharacterized membrane protein YsdA (DUF1294 family)